jgi:hypothetical protein
VTTHPRGHTQGRKQARHNQIQTILRVALLACSRLSSPLHHLQVWQGRPAPGTGVRGTCSSGSRRTTLRACLPVVGILASQSWWGKQKEAAVRIVPTWRRSASSGCGWEEEGFRSRSRNGSVRRRQRECGGPGPLLSCSLLYVLSTCGRGQFSKRAR